MEFSNKDKKIQSAVDSILEKEWHMSAIEESSIKDDSIKERMWNNIYKEVHTKRIFTRTMIAAACISAILLSVFMLKNDVASNKFDNVVLAENDMVYILPDSSYVYIEKGSCIKFKKSFADNREIWLEGNSTFDVRNTGGSQFKVHLDGGIIKVKGTCFYVEQDDINETSVMLYNGKIDYTPDTGGNAVELVPSQILVHNTASDVITVGNVSSKIKWEKGKYNFTDVPIREFCKFLTKKYDAVININIQSNETYSITGSISYNESLKSVIEKICFSLNLKYEKQEDSFILSEIE